MQDTGEGKKEKSDEVKNGAKWLKVLSWVIFPIGLFRMWYRFFAKRFNPEIATKTTVLNSVVFFAFMALYIAFVIINACFNNGDKVSEMVLLIIVTVVYLPVCVFVFASVCKFTSRNMLSPIRKMIGEMDEISAEDLSFRLKPTDSGDELSELTDRINKLLDDVEASLKRQRNFVSDASHELRTPISVVRGYADLISRWGKKDESILDEAITAIITEADNMKSIVEQMLCLARLGSFRLRLSEFNLSEVIKDIVEAYDMTNVDKTVTARMADNIPIVADRGLMVELIRIITDNAIKYTQPGGKVEIMAATLSEGGARIVIKDDGDGIPEEDLPHIFDRFYRCDKARTREGGSTGLGLAIAKSIADMMNGQISVRSKRGIGSEFSITLAGAKAAQLNLTETHLPEAVQGH